MSKIAIPPPPPIFDAEGGNVDSPVFAVPAEGLGIDLDISAAATVTVYVSNHPDAQRSPGSATWHDAGSYTAAAAFTVPGAFNWGKLNISGNTGTVTARPGR